MRGGCRGDTGDHGSLLVGDEDHLIEPCRIISVRDRLILGKAPAQDAGSGREVDAALLPAAFPGNARGGGLLGAVDREAEKIVGRLRLDLPPEIECAGTCYRGFHP